MAIQVKIVDDGHDIDKKIDIKLTDDTPSQIIKSKKHGNDWVFRCFWRCKSDLVILLGDRFEILSAAFQPSLKTFQSHIYMEVSRRSIWWRIQHSITKYLLAFVQQIIKEWIQLEKSLRVFKVGGLGVDLIK